MDHLSKLKLLSLKMNLMVETRIIKSHENHHTGHERNLLIANLIDYKQDLTKIIDALLKQQKQADKDFRAGGQPPR